MQERPLADNIDDAQVAYTCNCIENTSVCSTGMIAFLIVTSGLNIILWVGKRYSLCCMYKLHTHIHTGVFVMA